MDITSLYYFSELAKDMHVTRCANRLFISQQTLSNHIKRLENDLGVALLYRKPSLSLTDAGEKVLSFAKNVNNEYANLKDILADIEHEECGVIRFGASPARMNSCIPHILPEFTSRYPKVEFRLTNAMSSQLETMVLDGKLDFAMILAGDNDAKLSYKHLFFDQIYICIPDVLLKEHFGNHVEIIKKESAKGVDITDFASLPFCLQENRLGKKLLEIFEEHEILPNIHFSTADNRISTALCRQNIAACFTTHMCLIDSYGKIPDELNIFPVYHHLQPMREELVIIHRKDRYITRYSQHFLDLLFHYSNNLSK